MRNCEIKHFWDKNITFGHSQGKPGYIKLIIFELDATESGGKITLLGKIKISSGKMYPIRSLCEKAGVQDFLLVFYLDSYLCLLRAGRGVRYRIGGKCAKRRIWMTEIAIVVTRSEFVFFAIYTQIRASMHCSKFFKNIIHFQFGRNLRRKLFNGSISIRNYWFLRKLHTNSFTQI